MAQAVVEVQTSAYWMKRVADAAAELSKARHDYTWGRIPFAELARKRELYDQAYHWYTDPFDSKTYA